MVCDEQRKYIMERFSPAIVTVVASYHDIRCLDIVYTFSLTERFSPAMVTVDASYGSN